MFTCFLAINKVQLEAKVALCRLMNGPKKSLPTWANNDSGAWLAQPFARASLRQEARKAARYFNKRAAPWEAAKCCCCCCLFSTFSTTHRNRSRWIGTELNSQVDRLDRFESNWFWIGRFGQNYAQKLHQLSTKCLLKLQFESGPFSMAPAAAEISGLHLAAW